MAPRATRSRRLTISMRWTVMAVTVVMVAAAVIAMAVVHETLARRALTPEIHARVLLEARHLALRSAGALHAEFPELALHPVVNETKSRNPDLSLVLVLDATRIIQGDSDAGRLGTRFEEGALRPEKTRLVLETGETLVGDARTLMATAPVSQEGRALGTVVVGIPRTYLGNAVAAGRRELMAALLPILGLAAFAAFVVMSTLLAPVGALRAGLERIGRGDLKSPLRIKVATEIGALADTVNDMLGGLARVQAEAAERERVAHERDLARRLQSSLLPTARSESGGFVIEGSQQPASEAGAASFDHFVLADGALGVAMASVSAKGYAGCLVLSRVGASLRALREAYRSPAELLAQLDETLAQTLESGTFVRLFYGVIDPSTATLTYASAGHGPVLVQRASQGQGEWLKSNGVPLGATRDGSIRKSLRDETLEIEPGDLIVLTEGVGDARDSKGNGFGAERASRTVESSARHGGAGVLAGLHQAIEDWTSGHREVDATVIVVSRDAQTAPARKPELRLVPPATKEASPARSISAPPMAPRPIPESSSATPGFGERPLPPRIAAAAKNAATPAEASSTFESRPHEAPRIDAPTAKGAPGTSAPLDLETGPPRSWSSQSSGDRSAPPPASSAGQSSSQDGEIEKRKNPWETAETIGQLEGLESARTAPPSPADTPRQAKSPALPLSIVPRLETPAATPPANGAGTRASSPAEGAAPAQEPHAEALRVLEESRVRGRHLSLQATFQSLVSLRTWTAALYPPGTISDQRFQLLSTALYEACANIVEHGCSLDPSRTFEVFWLPTADETDQPAWLESGYIGDKTPGASTRAPGVSECRFVIRDHGIPFAADNWKATDFSDREVWKRGRGFGMDIIHRVMKHVAYYPGTSEGNLTLMEFDSGEARDSSGEQRHVR